MYIVSLIKVTKNVTVHEKDIRGKSPPPQKKYIYKNKDQSSISLVWLLPH